MNRGTPAVESVKGNTGPTPSRLRALAEIAGTAAAFALASSFSSLFQQASGASYLFAPAAVIFAASIAFGVRGVAGVALGTLFERWGGASTPAGAVAFMLVHGVTAGIGAWMLRTPVGGSGRRLQRVFAYGCLLPNLWSAVAGPLVLAGLDFIPRTFASVIDTGLPWWMSDIAATCVLGAPLLLLLRPEALLTPADIDLMRDWLRRSRGALSCLLQLVGGGVLLFLWSHGRPGPFPHWLTVPLSYPMALAALQGGAGPAMLMNGAASLLYLAIYFSSPDAAVMDYVSVAPAYATVGFFTLFAWIGGPLAGRNKRLLARVRDQQQRLELDFERTVASLAAAIEAKDATTEGHVQRVAQLAAMVGRHLGMTDLELRILRYGSLLHDVGKIGVPERVLNKPGPLTPSEKREMERHVEIGLRIVRDVEWLRDIEPLIRYHQERWDGATTGTAYPGYFGLAGEDIPLGARVLAVVDAFDAITHDRPYRRGRPMRAAIDELEREAGKQFDPRVVEALVSIVRREHLVAESGPYAAIAAS
jgi:putative nucleotidyltransferase with HDIG domain